MNQAFETVSMPVVIESLTYSGSAFGVNEDGEQVFINARIVDVCKLQEGMSATARVLPNYADKRDVIPWRAIRVDRPSVELPEFSMPPVPPAKEIDHVMTPAELEDQIMVELSNGEYWTTVELSNVLDLDTKTTGNACLRLFQKGRIAKAEVHAKPNQGRASFLLWARSADVFTA